MIEKLSEELIEVVGRTGIGIKRILDEDSIALSRGDMKYLRGEWWGKLPSYAQYIMGLREMGEGVELSVKEMEAEVLGQRYEEGLREIMGRGIGEMDGSEGRRFIWGEKMIKIQERKMDRIEKKRGGARVEKGIDIAMRVMSMLSDKDIEETRRRLDEARRGSVKRITEG